jgi:hypothetical protein
MSSDPPRTERLALSASVVTTLVLNKLKLIREPGESYSDVIA